MPARNGGPPKKVAAGPAQDRPATNTHTQGQSNAHRPEDGYAPPTADDREVAAAIDVLRAYGYGIACRCLDCNRPITAAASLARMRGPWCARRAGVTI